MADSDFKNPTFDPTDQLTMAKALTSPTPLWTQLPPRVQQELNTSGDNIQSLRAEIREAELEAQKKRLVDTFYKQANRAYGLHPDSIDYDQFRIDADGKTPYWTPDDKKILIITTRRGIRFLALSTMASRYGLVVQMHCGVSLELAAYTRKSLSSSAVKALQQVDKTIPSNLENIELKDLPGIADSALQSAQQVETP